MVIKRKMRQKGVQAMKKAQWLKGSTIILVFAFILGVTGCSNFSIFPPTQTPTPSPTETPIPTPVDTGINFTLPSLDGGEVSLIEFRGKPVLVFFFKSYCPHCQEEASAIQDIYYRHQEELAVIGIAVNKSGTSSSLIASPEVYAQMIRANFVNTHGWTFPVLIDNYGEVQKEYAGGLGVPSFLFLNEKGEIEYTLVGAASESELESLLYQYIL